MFLGGDTITRARTQTCKQFFRVLVTYNRHVHVYELTCVCVCDRNVKDVRKRGQQMARATTFSTRSRGRLSSPLNATSHLHTLMVRLQTIQTGQTKAQINGLIKNTNEKTLFEYIFGGNRTRSKTFVNMYKAFVDTSLHTQTADYQETGTTNIRAICTSGICTSDLQVSVVSSGVGAPRNQSKRTNGQRQPMALPSPRLVSRTVHLVKVRLLLFNLCKICSHTPRSLSISMNMDLKTKPEEDQTVIRLPTMRLYSR